MIDKEVILVMKEQDVKQVYKTLQLEKDGFGEVQISGEVVASIAVLQRLRLTAYSPQ